ncbi:hypothetical protein [Synechococcus sp. PCC 6312]|uniref:hypothetical protein n=1 Tax=Synechococcus sp. (strain ATCC 27167 / PCC 6312) TaxID=195253 RepID=UPI00029EE3CF|nr:hypothetical protein [Synechococcus sp. PCC 6312]AFY60410.1 hypothetical protein Syn6312_1228 [Synechococcus sp. PCC 6312]
MASLLDLLLQFNKYFKKARISKSGENHPENLIRLCRNRVDFITIINETINCSNQNWNNELINRVIQCVFDGVDSGISVYSSDTLDPLDYGHAFAVMAEGISQQNFRSDRGSKRKSHCTRGSLIIPTSYLPTTTNFKSTPENNLDFSPADQYHFDLTIHDFEELAITLLNGIQQRIIKWSFMGNEGKFIGSYRIQAAIAYSHCLQKFGKLNPDIPPSDWINGKTITASEQINTLMHLAQVDLVDSP